MYLCQEAEGAALKGNARGSGASLRRVSVPAALSLPVSDIPMSSSRVVKHEIVLPCDGDFMNICFGGQARHCLLQPPVAQQITNQLGMQTGRLYK